RDVLHVLRINQQHREGVLQDVVHRFPVHTRGFHRHVCHLVGCQPVSQRQKILGHRAERADDLLAPPVRRRNPHARSHRLLANVQPTAPPYNSPPRSSLSPPPGGASILGVCLSCSRQQFGVPEAPTSH